MKYLMIQNSGVAPVEAFTLLGASLSRDNDTLLGQFGSGAKLAIPCLLRKGLKVVIYCGKTRMDFKTKTITVDDGIDKKQQRQVYVQFSGTSTKKLDLGWVLDWGALDWTNEDMAIREFVANAIDRTIKGGNTVTEAQNTLDLDVRIVSADSCRAKSGYTRVFIEANEACEEYVDDLPHRFLHFSGIDTSQTILPKLGDRKKAQIYFNGVFVRELAGHPDSVFDYNFAGSEIKIDESRNLDEWTARAAIARAYRNATPEVLAQLFVFLKSGRSALELGLDPFYMKPAAYRSLEGEQKEAWREAWQRAYGDAVACTEDQANDVGAYIRRKGRSLGVVSNAAMFEILKAYGVDTPGTILNEDEAAGRAITDATWATLDTVDLVWELIFNANILDEKAICPIVKGFNEVTAESKCKGFHRSGEVFIRNDLVGEELLATVLEEVVRCVTGSEHTSLDLRSFLIKLITRNMLS